MPDQTGLVIVGNKLIILPDDLENPKRSTSGTIVQSWAKGVRSQIPVVGDRVFYSNAHIVEWDIGEVTHVIVPWQDICALPQRPDWPNP